MSERYVSNTDHQTAAEFTAIENMIATSRNKDVLALRIHDLAAQLEENNDFDIDIEGCVNKTLEIK